MTDKDNYKKRSIRYNGRQSMDKSTDYFFDNLSLSKHADENTRWLDTNEAADFLRLTPNALRILVHRAQVKYFKFGSRLRFRRADLDALLQTKEN